MDDLRKAVMARTKDPLARHVLAMKFNPKSKLDTKQVKDLRRRVLEKPARKLKPGEQKRIIKMKGGNWGWDITHPSEDVKRRGKKNVHLGGKSRWEKEDY